MQQRRALEHSFHGDFFHGIFSLGLAEFFVVTGGFCEEFKGCISFILRNQSPLDSAAKSELALFGIDVSAFVGVNFVKDSLWGSSVHLSLGWRGSAALLSELELELNGERSEGYLSLFQIEFTVFTDVASEVLKGHSSLILSHPFPLDSAAKSGHALELIDATVVVGVDQVKDILWGSTLDF